MYFEKGQESFGITNWQIAAALLNWTCQIDPYGGPDFYRPSGRTIPFKIVEEYAPSSYLGIERVTRDVGYIPLVLTHDPIPERSVRRVHWLFVIDGDPEFGWWRTLLFGRGRLWVPDDAQGDWMQAQQFLMRELDRRQKSWMRGQDNDNPEIQRMEKQTTWQRNSLAL